MQYQYIPYIWPLTASAVITLSLGIYALMRRRNVKCDKSFMMSMFVVTVWSGTNALEMSAISLSTKLFWANMQYFAYCYSPVTLLALCMEFTGYDKWIRNKKIFLLAIIPTIIILLVWSDRLYGMVRYDIHMDYSGEFPVIAKKYGPAFFIHGTYSHFLNIAAGLILLRAIFVKNTVYRKQVVALLIGVSFIVVPNILYISGVSSIKRFDITPVFFGPAGLIMCWSIFRYKMFDLVPLARATVIENMDAGMMVLDLQNRILDLNPAFEDIIGLNASKISAMKAEKVCSDIPALAIACKDWTITHSEFSINTGGLPRVYEVFLSPVADKKGILTGRLLVTYDITDKKREQQEHLQQQWRLAVMEERERVVRDMHDNLGQVLGFINLQAQGIRKELMNADIGIVSDKLDKLVEITQSAHNEIREYIRNVRNSVDMEKNFIDTLKKDILRFEEQTGINVNLQIPDELSCEMLKPNVWVNMLNIVKEAMNNVRKHAEAQNVKVSFSFVQHELCAAVEDDGKGFDTLKNRSSIKTKFGLDIMRERASEIGGRVDINSVAGKGSRVLLCVPVNEEIVNEIDVGR